ncbi:C-GCAxxG-C-C family protein [Paraclostridium bifermentans]|jgi:C_GCAxxG_C_C family probable redox protein|uniref:C_GCAxxG_C_C family protein n=1 Tax=Paraclostridium bifermentans TaxID=1490 RepID=A0A1X2JKN3_PARBF|nr:C-GCAxxG-C-C family protein [Paraclostridium bifermentans]KGJ49851.1 C_GCAxxG_C_C family protein [Clostridium sp. NCR]MBN8047069.1 C_GCAxxG_C_C family protein [Paraclostridium bifermentans]MCR1874541.1 C-GCAxxG-C-C family protein [Paraclostridium bifermentans]MDU3334893.1 C-GCAxxG-C-C family protein [Paraclostridium bifermentans]NME08859.1 C_GCAxxG_C_C family protein [Paraclostridium bifermentans]
MEEKFVNKEQRVSEIRKIAEGYFERGEFFCSEAVVKTINDELGKPFSDEVTKLASGFPIGVGKSGCLCGAVSGGVMALGMVYGRCHGEAMHEDMFKHAADLHDRIKELYKSTCCRVMTRNFEFQSPERKAHCIKITGEVAAYIAEKLIDDGKLK